MNGVERSTCGDGGGEEEETIFFVAVVVVAVAVAKMTNEENASRIFVDDERISFASSVRSWCFSSTGLHKVVTSENHERAIVSASIELLFGEVEFLSFDVFLVC